MFGIVIIRKRKCVVGIEPIVLGVAAFFCSS